MVAAVFVVADGLGGKLADMLEGIACKGRAMRQQECRQSGNKSRCARAEIPAWRRPKSCLPACSRSKTG